MECSINAVKKQPNRLVVVFSKRNSLDWFIPTVRTNLWDIVLLQVIKPWTLSLREGIDRLFPLKKSKNPHRFTLYCIQTMNQVLLLVIITLGILLGIVSIVVKVKDLQYTVVSPETRQTKSQNNNINHDNHNEDEGHHWFLRKLGFGNNKDRLRLVVFGGANSWGIGLKSRFMAYPYLLSQTVDNFAHSSMGPNYYAVCSETIIGDDTLYDVIVLDYWLKYTQGLDDLAHRLRDRFPQAIIILMRNWEPIHFRRKVSNSKDIKESQNIIQWKLENGLEGASLSTVIEALEKDTGYWYLPERGTADATLWQIVQTIGGYEFSFQQRETGKQTLVDFLGYFDETQHSHVSELGHKAITEAMTFIIQSHRKKNMDGTMTMISSNVQGNWDGGDVCDFWYFTGGTRSSFGNFQMSQFDVRNGHFGLELLTNVSSPEEAWITISNRLKDDSQEMTSSSSSLSTSRTLFMSYHTSKMDGFYPNVEVTVLGHTVTLNTWNTMDEHHDIRTVAIGSIPMGKTNITMIPISLGQEPFRVIGMTLSNEKITPLEWDFGPSRG
jgi:hypothetical protein